MGGSGWWTVLVVLLSWEAASSYGQVTLEQAEKVKEIYTKAMEKALGAKAECTNSPSYQKRVASMLALLIGTPAEIKDRLNKERNPSDKLEEIQTEGEVMTSLCNLELELVCVDYEKCRSCHKLKKKMFQEENKEACEYAAQIAKAAGKSGGEPGEPGGKSGGGMVVGGGGMILAAGLLALSSVFIRPVGMAAPFLL